MKLLQIKVTPSLLEAIKEKAKQYGVPVSSLVKITLSQTFLEEKTNDKPGNIFNAERDSNNKGIPLEEFLNEL